MKKQLLRLMLTAGSVIAFHSFTFAQSKQEEKIEKKINAKLAKFKRVPDEGITSTTHQKNLGKIIWANEIIDRENTDPSKIKSEFNVTDFIYGRAYFKESISNVPIYVYEEGARVDVIPPCSSAENGCIYTAKLYIAGKLVWETPFDYMSEEQVDLTSFQVWIRPIPEHDETSKSYRSMINKLPVGRHQVRIEFHSTGENYSDDTRKKQSEPMAVGEFTYVKNEGDKIPFGKTFADYGAGMRDREAEQGMLACLRQHAQDQGWKGEIIDIKIKDQNWTVKRHEWSGRIIYRGASAYVYYQKADGVCAVQSYSFGQESLNDGYDRFKLETFFSTMDEVDCTH